MQLFLQYELIMNLKLSPRRFMKLAILGLLNKTSYFALTALRINNLKKLAEKTKIAPNKNVVECRIVALSPEHIHRNSTAFSCLTGI